MSASSSGSSSGLICDRHLAAAQPDAHAHAHHNDQLPIFALTLILIGGGFCQHYFSQLPLPYTMLLLIFGSLLGLWVKYDPAFTLQPGMQAFEHSWSGNVLQCNVTEYVANDLFNYGSHLGNSLRELAEVDPHLFLQVLLPPLLFESAFAIDWHIFSKIVKYAVFLALPGLAFCVSVTGSLYIWFYGWSWESAMLLGGILSATDPVAVVALLREMGVKKSLATLIEAESLLNDGTAVVVYAILLRAVQAGGLSAWLDASSDIGGWFILWFFFRMSVLGPLFGIMMGMLSLVWLQANSGADRDANVEVICTLAMPYLVFYLAETAFGEEYQMSGVLAVVCYGLTFASPFGKVRIDPGIEHFLHEFWGMLGHLTNTLVFVISGVIIVISVDTRSPTFGADVGYGIATYAIMCLTRGVLMFGVTPLFRGNHYGWTWRDALVITWGGLRGAVGLALAVSVAKDVELPGVSGMFGDDDGAHFQQVVLLHTSITVGATLLVNAPTSGPLLKYIGLTKLSEIRVSMLQMSLTLLNKRQRATLANMAMHTVHSDVEWVTVQKLVSFDELVKCDILGMKHFAFDEKHAWHPPKDRATADGHHEHGLHETVGCRKPRRDTKPDSYHADGAEPSAPDGAEPSAPSVIGGDATLEDEHAHTKPMLYFSRATEEVQEMRRSMGDHNMLRRGASAGVLGGDLASRSQLVRAEQLRVAHTAWVRLRTKMQLAMGFGDNGDPDGFGNDLQQRLQNKRSFEAKYRMLEQLKACVWGMYELGHIQKYTAVYLKEMVLGMVDNLEAGREFDNPFPFAPLKAYLQLRPSVLRFAALFESLIHKSYVLRPLAPLAHSLLFREFERGYDAAVAYLLINEEVLIAHDHGHKFSLDSQLDAHFKSIVKGNIREAVAMLAMLRLDWPKLCRALNTFKAARQVLNAGKDLIEELHHHGGLHETEAERLLDLIAQRAVKLSQMSPTEALPAADRDFFMPESFGQHSVDTLRRAQAAMEMGLRRQNTQKKEKLRERSESPHKDKERRKRSIRMPGMAMGLTRQVTQKAPTAKQKAHKPEVDEADAADAGPELHLGGLAPGLQAAKTGGVFNSTPPGQRPGHAVV